MTNKQDLSKLTLDELSYVASTITADYDITRMGRETDLHGEVLNRYTDIIGKTTLALGLVVDGCQSYVNRMAPHIAILTKSIAALKRKTKIFLED